MRRNLNAVAALRRLAIPVAAGGLLFAGGCLSAGPNYTAPVASAPERWESGLTAGLSSNAVPGAALSRWWTVLNDSLLSDLMEQARTNNLDLRQADARLRQARAQRGIAGADRFPTVGTTAGARRSTARGDGGTDVTTERYSAGLDASWELDFFGRKRRALEAAEASLDAAREDLHDVLVSLFAEVALSYVDVRAYQTRLAISETNLAIQSETYDIARWRREAGLTTQLDEDQALLSLEQTRAEMPSLRTGLEQAMHRLALLTGQLPGALRSTLADRKAIPVTPAALAVGVPADALRQRPDVRRAERQLAAQTARIGVAAAARYPSFTLSGSIGLESLAFGNLFSAGARTTAEAAGAAWTLIDGGRIRREVEVQTARQEEAFNLYQAAVLAALADVENALVAYANEQTRGRSLAEAARLGQSALALARDQYSSGLIGFQAVLDAQRTLLSVQSQSVASHAEATSNLIRLYKALGGGWAPLAPAATPANPPIAGETP